MLGRDWSRFLGSRHQSRPFQASMGWWVTSYITPLYTFLWPLALIIHPQEIGGFAVHSSGKRVVICATIDNLLKGAATQCLRELF